VFWNVAYGNRTFLVSAMCQRIPVSILASVATLGNILLGGFRLHFGRLFRCGGVSDRPQEAIYSSSLRSMCPTAVGDRGHGADC